MEGRGRRLRRLRAEGLILPLVALLTLAADQLSKQWIVTHLEWGQSMDLASWLTPVLRLTHITNTGVAFGLLQGMGDIFTVVAVVVVGVLLWYHHSLPPGHILLRIALGLQLGGAIGNLTDRLVRGAVVDFIDFNFWPLHRWPLFNLADASIVTGVGLLMLMMLFNLETAETGEESKQQEAG